MGGPSGLQDHYRPVNPSLNLVSSPPNVGYAELLVRALALGFIVPLFTPFLHTVLRAAFRPFVVFHAERGLEWVVYAQQHQHSLLTALFTISSQTVSVAFYVTFLPILLWVGDAQLGSRLIFLMALAVYVGNAMKDLIGAPRPVGIKKGKDQARLLAMSNNVEVQINSLEYGMPSSHTMNSLTLNFYMAYYSLETGLVAASFAPYLYVACTLWLAWIGVARVYMGLHTPIDIFGGLLAGAVVSAFFISVDDAFETWVLTSPYLLPIMLLACVIILRLHPKPLRHTPSYEFSVSFVGVAFGQALGMSKAPAANFTESMLSSALTAAGAFAIVRRLALGFMLLAANKAVAKRVMLWILPAFYLMYPLSFRQLWQPPMHDAADAKQHRDANLGTIPLSSKGLPLDVEVTARFMAYASIGWTVVYLVPRLCVYLGW